MHKHNSNNSHVYCLFPLCAVQRDFHLLFIFYSFHHLGGFGGFAVVSLHGHYIPLLLSPSDESITSTLCVHMCTASPCYSHIYSALYVAVYIFQAGKKNATKEDKNVFIFASLSEWGFFPLFCLRAVFPPFPSFSGFCFNKASA